MTQSHKKGIFLIYVSGGRFWRQRIRVVLTCCDERAWHDMGEYVAGRRGTCSWRAWDGLATWAGSGSRETGKYDNMASQDIMGAHGDIMEHWGEVLSDGRAWWAVIWHWRYLPASCYYRHTSRAFLSGKMRGWSYVNAKTLIWKRYEVLERSPWREGASCNGWSTWFGGSWS